MTLHEYQAANAGVAALPLAERKAALCQIKSARQRTINAARRVADPAWWMAVCQRSAIYRQRTYVPATRAARSDGDLPPHRADLVPIDDHARDGRVKMVADMHGARCISAVFIAGVWVFPTCAAHLGFQPEFYLP